MTVQWSGCYGGLQQSCGAELSLPLWIHFWTPDVLLLLLSSVAASNLVTHVSLGHMGQVSSSGFLPLPPGPLSPRLTGTPGDRQLS